MSDGLISGIALRIAREGAQPDYLPVHPTRAAQLHALVELGPRPPWWRPFARRRWAWMREGIIATRPLAFAALTKDPTSPGYRYAELCERETAAAHAAMDAKERELDDHGYGGQSAGNADAQHPVTGLASFIPRSKP